MMSKAIKTLKLSDTLELSQWGDGFWLYDTTRGMNVSMRVKSDIEALIEALMYYQKRLKIIEDKYKDISQRVELFVSQFPEDHYE